MRFPKRDLTEIGLVAAAGLIYLLWAIGSTLPGLSGARASGVVILAFGFAASATAVVPSFDQLLRGNRAYLATTALLGFVVLIGGVMMLTAASKTGLASYGDDGRALAYRYRLACATRHVVSRIVRRRPYR